MATTGALVFDKDAYVDEANPSVNYDTGGLFVGCAASKASTSLIALAYVDFSAFGLTADQVTAAVCKMYCGGETNEVSGAKWYRSSSDFTESTVSWNTKPAYDGTVFSDVQNPEPVGWTTWNILDMITDAITNRSGIWNAQCWATTYSAGVDDLATFCKFIYIRRNPCEQYSTENFIKIN